MLRPQDKCREPFAKVHDRNPDAELWERIMTGNLEARSQQAHAETKKHLSGQAQGDDTLKAVPHPFDRRDLILIAVPIAIVVFGLWWEATGFRGR